VTDLQSFEPAREEPRERASGPTLLAPRRRERSALATRVAGRGLAEEYFERGAIVRPGDVVIDVGANVGAFAAAVAERTRGDVSLHCFEPSAPTFEKLQRTFAQHDAMQRTRHELHALALGGPEDDGTERTFYHFTRFPTDSTYDLAQKMREFETFFAKKADALAASLARFGPPGRLLGRALRALLLYVCRSDNRFGVWLAWRVTGMREMRCRLASLDRIVLSRGLERIDLLKIDVEGAELDVLRGCDEAWPRIRQVAIETVEVEGRADAIVQLLESRGLRVISCEAPRVAAAGDARQLLVVARRDD
jgi:FkbM family methyltransferase